MSLQITPARADVLSTLLSGVVGQYMQQSADHVYGQLMPAALRSVPSSAHKAKIRVLNNGATGGTPLQLKRAPGSGYAAVPVVNHTHVEYETVARSVAISFPAEHMLRSELTEDGWLALQGMQVSNALGRALNDEIVSIVTTGTNWSGGAAVAWNTIGSGQKVGHASALPLADFVAAVEKAKLNATETQPDTIILPISTLRAALQHPTISMGVVSSGTVGNLPRNIPSLVAAIENVTACKVIVDRSHKRTSADGVAVTNAASMGDYCWIGALGASSMAQLGALDVAALAFAAVIEQKTSAPGVQALSPYGVEGAIMPGLDVRLTYEDATKSWVIRGDLAFDVVVLDADLGTLYEDLV